MVKIIIDSTCDLPEELIKKYDVGYLPLRVFLSDKEYLDGVTIRVDQVYQAMREGIVPMTSQPRPEDVNRLLENCCINNEDFIYLSFSSKLSCTYQLAVSVVQELKDRYPNVKMEVADSKGGSTATGLIALQAAKMADLGYSFEDILAEVYQLIDHVEHIFTISNLNWLIKGGRISRREGIIGDILDIKPVLHVRDGIMEVVKKVRGRKKALSAVVDMVTERIRDFPDQILGISHADDLNTALELYEMIKQRIGEKKIIINKIGSVLGSHLGIGGVGIFFFNKKPNLYFSI